jgi:hypothetical protein
MAQAYPTLNEIEPSWADIAIAIALYSGPTIKTTDVAAITWSDSVDVGTVYGANGGRIKKTTTGQLSCEASLTLYKTGWKTLRTALAAKNKRITLVHFDIFVQHTLPGETTVHTVKILGARVVGRSGNDAEGTDASQIEIPINVKRIEEDGVSLL